MKSKEEIRDIFYDYSMIMYDCYCKLWDICNLLPNVLDIDGNSPRKKELLEARDRLLQLHQRSMDFVNGDLM